MVDGHRHSSSRERPGKRDYSSSARCRTEEGTRDARDDATTRRDARARATRRIDRFRAAMFASEIRSFARRKSSRRFGAETIHDGRFTTDDGRRTFRVSRGRRVPGRRRRRRDYRRGFILRDRCLTDFWSVSFREPDADLMGTADPVGETRDGGRGLTRRGRRSTTRTDAGRRRRRRLRPAGTGRPGRRRRGRRRLTWPTF